jgi:hypothetical protein
MSLEVLDVWTGQTDEDQEIHSRNTEEAEALVLDQADRNVVVEALHPCQRYQATDTPEPCRF